MPSFSVTRKGIYTDGLDGNKDKKEERCFFGLLSFRGVVILKSALYLVIPLLTGFTTTREEFSMSIFASTFNMYIPIPFMDRGTTIWTLYYTVLASIGLYGAYNRSYRAIKIFRMASDSEFFWYVADLTSGAFNLFRMLPLNVTNEYLVDLAKKSGRSIDLYISSYIGWLVCCIPGFIAFTAIEIHMLYALRRFEEILAPEREEGLLPI